jgi:hypothetical protein
MSIRKRRKDGSAFPPLEPIAGNGLLDRRALLGRGIVLAGAVTTGASTALTSAAAEPLTMVHGASRTACLSRRMASRQSSSRRWCAR